ncbi:MAG: DUF4391 domain-containing protein [Verrucomicrobiota bacterium]
MYHYPDQAYFGKPIRKATIYRYSGVTHKTKQLITSQIEQIEWSYKLAPETINLPANSEIKEIQIITLWLKGRELHPSILTLLDHSIRFPIWFEVISNDRFRFVAAIKRQSEADFTQQVLSEHFHSDWIVESQLRRQHLPTAINLEDLWTQMLAPLLPLKCRSNESTWDWSKRCEKWKSFIREAEKLEKKLRKEKQFNRKVGLNQKLRAVRSQISQCQK